MKSRLILLGAALAFASVARADFTPIPVTPDSYTADVVVEKTATPSLAVVTTASVDQGTNNGANTWMEAGFDPANPAFGLPAPGTVIVALSNANYSFQMPPSYTAPNGILINASQVTNGTLTLVTPAKYAMLSFLGSGGNGGDVIGVKIRHEDGTVQTGDAFPCPDWFNGTSNVAFIANERVGSTVNLNYANINSGNPRLYFRDILVKNTTSAITNVELYYISGSANSHNDVLAVSGATTLGGPVTPVAVTGWTYDFIVEKEAAKRGRIVNTTGDWATSESMDNTGNTAYSWYERGYNLNNADGGGIPILDVTLSTNSGLPAAGATITNAAGDRVYTMPPSYTANNACYMSATIPSATMTLTTPFAVTPVAPATASVLSFLAGAGGGQRTIEVAINYEDGTSETNGLVVPDWFNATVPFVWNANGRVAVDTGQFDAVRRSPNAPRLFNCDLVLTKATSAITNILLNHTNLSAQVAVFAVSGSTGPVPPVFLTTPQTRGVAAGANVQLSGTATDNTSTPITYQWQRLIGGVWGDLTDGGKMSGATTTTLSLTGVADAEDGTYRLAATGAAGVSYSPAAVLTVLSALSDVTQPGDPIVLYQPNGGSTPAAEGVANAIDNTTTKYLNYGNGVNPLIVPVGFTVTPSMGRTKVTAMRLYTANDAESRDPANVILLGSDDGGASWTLIYSNSIALPSGRNAAGLALDPLSQNLAQVRFENANGYTMYRWYTTRLKPTTDRMQIGEVELLGVADTSGKPAFTTHPASQVVYVGSPATFTATASGTPTPSLRWLKGTNGVYVGVTDGGNISGAQTDTLSVNPAQFADAADYVCVAKNTSGSTTSTVARLTVISTLLDVTVPADPITGFGDTSGTQWGLNADPINAIDNFSTVKYQNGGSGLNAPAGFPPFGGPVGVVVTPAVGSTLVSGLRIYTADGNPERDPADFKLEGSSNGGATYTLLAAGPLSLPAARADAGQAFDPTTQPMQEILFSNHGSFTTYRLTFNHVRDDNNANSLQVGEIELLGVSAPPSPVLTAVPNGSGGLTLSSSAPGQLWSTTNLTGTVVWKNEGPITGSVTITPAPGEPQKYYRVIIP
jgi:hypothetical protein